MRLLVRRTARSAGTVLFAFSLDAGSVAAQHLSLWGGGGAGSFLGCEAHEPNGNTFTAGAVSLFADRFPYQPRQLVVLINAGIGAHF